MSVIVLEEISLGFGKKTLFDRLALRVAQTDRIGLIGPNGSGKTSLLRIIAGEQAPDSGNLRVSRGTRLGYLAQELELSTEQSLKDFVRASVPGRAELETALSAADQEMNALRKSARNDAAEIETAQLDLGERISNLHERLAHYDMQYSDHEMLRILAGLGFRTSDHDRSLVELSGGWRMRAVLASLLFQQPDLLLLDEPTNHLDMPTVAWFADFLKRYRKAFILICHDREFLNEQIERVVSFEPEAVRQYSGNYQTYLAQRAEEQVILENKAKNIQREREQAERFIARFRAQATKARAVQSRIKALQRMESVETYQTRRSMRFCFPPSERSGQDVLTLNEVSKRYGDNVVLDKLNLTVYRGEKIGIIGVNGAGKTTLLKMMAGEIEPDSGELRLGYNVTAGYYAQHHSETLERNATVFDQVAGQNPDAGITRVRTILGSFLFSGDDVDKKVSALSGGERSRVALARLLIKPGNLLLMDEPTNHLDLESSESLAESLTTYDGTLIFVSHNRSLMRRLAEKIWNVAERGVETYPGTLDEYLDSCRRRRNQGEQEPKSTPPQPRPAAPASADFPQHRERKASRAADKERKRLEALLREQRRRRLEPLEKQLGEIETAIAGLEELQRQRSELLADPGVYADKERSARLIRCYKEDKEKLDQLNDRWEKIQTELERSRS
ncbi:MAG: ABC-F family ATP-binding cassette domain-containing protein [Deltaproteobacteria bacterium]|nr:ABC-F family ATP-binding cassette domain-containing protein [Deltaproteobacteria bacterium]